MTTTPPVFIGDPAQLAKLGVGDLLELDGAEGAHAAKSLRLQPGERLDVVDGAGLRLRCVAVVVDKGSVEVEVAARDVEPAPAAPIVLVQALAKGGRDESAVEMAVELGVDAVIPWQAERSVVVWRGERAAKSLAKWQAVADAATKQSRRAWRPEVLPLADIKALAAAVAANIANGGTAWLLDPTGTPIAQAPLPEATNDAGATTRHSGVWRAEPDTARNLQNSLHHPLSALLIIIGPEGGINPRELAELTSAGAEAMRLGSNILRASTAGPAAIAIAAERLGRWA